MSYLATKSSGTSNALVRTPVLLLLFNNIHPNHWKENFPYTNLSRALATRRFAVETIPAASLKPTMTSSRLPVARRDATLAHSAAISQDVAIGTQQASEETATEVSNTQVIPASQDTYLTNIETTFASIDAHFTNVERTLASHGAMLAEIDRNTRDGPARFEEIQARIETMPARFEAIRREWRRQRVMLEGIIRLIVFFARALRA
jgi:septal ring factor EnvC (AmiA/AmiB activator)